MAFRQSAQNDGLDVTISAVQRVIAVAAAGVRFHRAQSNSVHVSEKRSQTIYANRSYHAKRQTKQIFLRSRGVISAPRTPLDINTGMKDISTKPC